MNSICRAAMTVLFVTAISPVVALGEVVFDNLLTPNGSVAVGALAPRAQSFTPSADVILTTVELNMTTGFAGGTFHVRLFTDFGNVPDSPIETLSGSLSPHPAGIYTYTAAGTSVLSANVTYWIVASESGDGVFYWNVETPAAVEVGTHIGRATFTQISWFNNSSDSAFSMRVNGDAVVPEPTRTAVTAMIGLVAAGLWPTARLRRRYTES